MLHVLYKTHVLYITNTCYINFNMEMKGQTPTRRHDEAIICLCLRLSVNVQLGIQTDTDVLHNWLKINTIAIQL